MAVASGGKTKHGRHWPSTMPKEGSVVQEDIINRGRALREGANRQSPRWGRFRSFSDSDTVVSSSNPDHRVVFDYRQSNIASDFTLYEEDEEGENVDLLNTNGFTFYEVGTDADLKEGTDVVQDKGFTVNAILPDGELVMLTGQRGMCIRDLIKALLTEHKLSTSLRIKHAIHKIPLNEDADASLLKNQTILLEKRDTQEPNEVTDRRLAILLDILVAEREYRDLLKSALNIYEQPLRKLPSLCNSDSKILLGGLKPLLKLSCTLVKQLEESVSSWDPESTKIGHMFHKGFWVDYEKYYTSYQIGKLLLLYLRQHNRDFVATCKELRGAARHSLDSLLLLPVQRVSQYDKCINELYSRTSPHHPDADNMQEAAETIRNMVKGREAEVGIAVNENRLQQVQDRFPSDDLKLTEKDTPKADKFKAAAVRRRSAPTTVLRSAFTSNKSKTIEKLQTNLLFPDQKALTSMEHHGRLSPPMWSSNNNNHQYIMEAPAECTVGVQTQYRYLFLFNDILIIAKQNKSGSNFRLKHRLRVSELWMATCIEDVCEISKPAECSFVLGWPTTNCVLTFSSLEERNLWWHCLEKHIDAQQDKEELKSLSVRVINKENKTAALAEQTQLTLQVGIAETAKKLLGICIEKFALESDNANEYQLWVRSSKETGMYPLIGHEIPYAIKMSHLRDVLAKYDDLLYLEDEDHVMSFAKKELPEHKCQFILRRVGKTHSGVSMDTSGVQKRLKKGKKSPFKLSFKRSMSNKPSECSNSPTGKLFGIALPILCPDNSLPMPVSNIITSLYNNGPFFPGIFRKSANARICREVRAKLDADEVICMEELPVAVTAALFKEFLRSLPDCVFAGELYENWLNTNNIADDIQRIEAIRSLLDQLPAANLMVMHHVFCMLHYINLHNDENNMNARNLAICVAPSLIWPPLSAGALAQAQATKKLPTLVEFMIEHATEVFGEDVVKVIGDPPIRKDGEMCHDSSGDSDSFHSGHDQSSMKRDDSSLESIERELYEHDLSPSPRTLHWPGQLLSPSTVSRDSGLTSSNNDLYPESETSDTTDSGVESKKETSGSNSSMGSQTGLIHSRSAGFVRDGMDIGFHDRRLSPSVGRRRDSEPQATVRAKRIVVRGCRTATENSPDTSDNEVEISLETMQMLQELNRESSLKLFSEIIQQSPRIPQNACEHSLLVTPGDNTEPVGTKSVQTTSNNFSRAPKWHSPSSEGHFPAHAMLTRSKQLQNNECHRQGSNGKLQRGAPVMERPKTLAVRPDQHSASNNRTHKKQMHSSPPRELFPRDATQTSLQYPRMKGIVKSQSDTVIQDGRQWNTERERSRMQTLISIPDIQHIRHTPPSYQEAMNRRAMIHRNTSVDSAGLKTNTVKTQPQRPRQTAHAKGTGASQMRTLNPILQSEVSQDENSYRVPVIESGIIYLTSDSELSDEDAVDMEHLQLYTSHTNAPSQNGLKLPSVRRTSSDRSESRDNRASSLIHSQDSLQRSSSERHSPLDSPTKEHSSCSQNATSLRPRLSRQMTTPGKEMHCCTVTLPKQQLLKKSLSAEAQKVHTHVGRTESNNSTTSADSGISPQTVLHFPFPDPHSEPPSLPVVQSKSVTRVDGKGDHVSELRTDKEFKQKILQARRNWQKYRQSSSTDSGAYLDDLDSIEFTEESYV